MYHGLGQNTPNGCGIHKRLGVGLLAFGPRVVDRAEELLGPHGSIFERVKLSAPGHRDRERPQRVQHFDGVGMLGDDLWQATVGHRAFVEIGADQRDAALLQSCIHLLAGETALGFLSAE